MIKKIIRTIFFISISLNTAQYVVNAFYFDDKFSWILYISGLSLLYFFIRFILGLISLPTSGVGFLFISFLLVVIISFAFTLFIPGFSVHKTIVSELIIFGFVLPSKQLNVVWSAVFASLLISVMMFFLDWLCEAKKK